MFKQMCRPYSIGVFAAAVAVVLATPSAEAGSGSGLRAAIPGSETCPTYTVASGDTIGAISKRTTGSLESVDQIFRMNGHLLDSRDAIEPGMVLQMPCDARIAAAPSPAAAAGWTARSGDFLVPVLTGWGREAGYHVIVENDSDWWFGVDYQGEGSFRDVIDDVLQGFSSAAVAPVVVFYENDVMTIGAR